MSNERKILKPAVRRGAAITAADLEAERLRLAAILSGAAAPVECGGRIIAAPARGPVRAVRQVQLLPKGASDWAEAEAGWAGWQPVRAVDVFDRLEEALTPGQVAMGRRYRGLVERHDAGGVRCSDLLAGHAGGEGGGFMDAFIAEGAELAAIRRRIGDGAALALRRIRPSASGGPARRAIPDRVLVDQVCLADRLPAEVLRAHGWAVDGAARKAAVEALCAALDRMSGYRD